MKKRWLVVWWMSKTPHAAIFANKASAEAAASVRNALLIEFEGEIVQAWDWWLRDEKGNPMPVEWRDLVGQVHSPCGPRPPA